ncbi:MULTISPECIES: DUF1015 family protein [unclassified Streptomyces]|uniref:DUF1015 family protein n=1 Tax=unclassified Streptomyces TaxID=2593676 RepID=UPI000CD4CDD5|nr:MULTISPECIES: DUF1015 domain-containing protein [unclassified Streptomyces]
MLTDGLDVTPFRGVRYVPERVGSLAAVTSPPYDVVVRPDGLHELQTSDPHNVVRLILPQAPDAATGHRNAARTLDRWLNEGVLARDDSPALYVYEQRRDGELQRGVIGALRLTPATDRVVLPHEDVMPQVIAERAALLRETAANLEPLLMSYQGDGGADGGDTATVLERTARAAPLLSTTTEDGFTHRLWAVTDPQEQRLITRDLATRTALVADGHHRWATSLRVSSEHGDRTPWNRGLVLLVDSTRYPLRIRAIHRVLPRLPLVRALELSAAGFRSRRLDARTPAAALAALADVPGPAFVLSGAGEFHLLDRPDPGLLARTIRADRPASWRELDATVLHSTLLDAVWHIPDGPSDIAFLHDTDAAVSQAERHGGTAVLMRPVAESTVRELAAQGVTMPRKSTSFGPKPATGLVLRVMET